ncbi:MAG TPA: response regulator transcription factor [Lentimicrobium sp.]|jgi:two-component system response regulator NreC|nr:response regulator transcription factor [Lentimicrobium sp.]
MIKLFLVDDHTIVLDGIKALLTGQPDIMITGEAANGEALLNLLEHSVPDVILMDISLPGRSGIELCRLVKEQWPAVKVLFLSMYTNEEFVLNAINAGASGYLPKNISQHELLLAIRTIYSGGDYFSGSVSDIILKSYLRKSRETDQKSPLENLSKREIEILGLVAEGLSNSEIADRVFISTRTVESHKNHIMQKLNLKTPVELVKFALKHNIARL